ncbi:hypothetical protein ACFVIM_29180 [Streptomyces sp. NPDC057638]|uniref:hypothetical protein n=1 Tax=Streptomyces sp. NPDC057638 TaxID=3346190 RepID=UPI003695F505
MAVPVPWPGAGPAVDVVRAFDRTLRLTLAGDRLRGVPSAGALHPVEIALLLGEGHGIPPGRYGYDPARHRLHRLGPAPGIAPGEARAVVGVRVERTVAHYGHRGWPLALLDAGHAVAGLVAVEGGSARWGAGWGVRFPLAVVGLGPGSDGALGPGRRPGSEAGPGSETGPGLGPRTGPRFGPVDPGSGPGHGRWAGGPGAGVGAGPEARQAFAVMTALAEAGRAARLGGVTGEPVVEEILRARRSAPVEAFTASGPPAEEHLAAVLAAAESAGPGGPDGPDGLGWWVALGGERPGLYAREGGRLRLAAAGEVLPTLAVWAARQGWLADAGAVLLAHGCPSDAAPERVLADHLLAGYGAGRAHLAATGLGLPARPVGSWQRADIGAALGGRAGRDWVVHGLALGARRSSWPGVRAGAW